MFQTKLLVILSTFSDTEKKALKKWLQSSAFNENKKVESLLVYLIENPIENWGKEQLFSHCFPVTEYEDVKLRRLFSSGFQAVEKFIVYYENQKSPIENELKLLAFYHQKQIPNLIESQLEKVQTLQSDNHRKNSPYYYNAFLIAEIEAANQSYRSQKEGENHLEKVEKNLDAFYLLTKLELYCASLAHQTVIASETEALFISEILAYIEQNPEIQTIPAIHIYYLLTRLLTLSEDESIFEQIQIALDLNWQVFSEQELKNIYSLLRNHCITHINQGKTSYYVRLFDIYCAQIEHNSLLSASGSLSPALFKNMIVLALRLGKDEWVERQIDTYQGFLPIEVAVETLHYVQARLYFYRKEWEKVGKTLLKTPKYTDIFFEIDARKLLIQTYFELAEWETVYNYLNTFRVFIHRNRTISARHKESNRNFCNAIEKLLKKDSINPKLQVKWKESIVQMTFLAEREWILSKV